MAKRKTDGAPLLDFGRDSHVTQSGLQKVLQAVERHGVQIALAALVGAPQCERDALRALRVLLDRRNAFAR